MAKIKEQAIVDLRSFDAKALKKIKLISCVGIVIIPKNADPEFTHIYAGIKKDAIGDVIEIDREDNLVTYNGSTVLTKDSVPENALVMINGMALVMDMPRKHNLRLICNGAIVKMQDASFSMYKQNGSVIDYPRDNSAPYRFYTGETTLDSAAVSYFENDTVIICSGQLNVTEGVTNEMLAEKNLFFILIGETVAPNAAISYIRANSYVCGLIETKEEEQERKKKAKRYGRI